MTIQSNQTTPSICATTLMSAAAGIGTGGEITEDDSSIITGYDTLKTSMSTESSNSNSVASSITQFVSLIQGVANDFQVLDDLLSQQIADNQESFVEAPNMADTSVKNDTTKTTSSTTTSLSKPSWMTATASNESTPDMSLFTN